MAAEESDRVAAAAGRCVDQIPEASEKLLTLVGVIEANTKQNTEFRDTLRPGDPGQLPVDICGVLSEIESVGGQGSKEHPHGVVGEEPPQVAGIDATVLKWVVEQVGLEGAESRVDGRQLFFHH